MSCDLKLADLLELSKIYAPEYNMPELHDRVLVFDVMKDGWEASAILASDDDVDTVVNNEENSVKVPSEKLEQDVKDERSSEDKHTDESKEVEADVGAGSSSGYVFKSETINQDGNSDEQSEKGCLRQHKIFVHSSWLSVQSKYFRSLFYSGTKI